MPSFHPKLVAVVVPVAQPPEMDLAARVRSWRSQVGVEVEVILVDATLQGLGPVPGAIVLRERSPARGRAFQRALEVTEAAWIAWAEPAGSDHPKRFARQLTALGRSGASLCTADLEVLGEDDQRRRSAVDLGFDEPPPAWEAGLMARREAVATMGTAAFWPVELELHQAARREGRLVHLAEALVSLPDDHVEAATLAARDDAALLRLRPRAEDEPPEVTVLLATHERCDVLLECLAAFSRQLLPRGTFELVVVDDGSTDGTREVAGALELAVPFRFLHQPPSGASVARSKALPHARGHLVLFVNDDTIPRPDTVLRHLEAHREFAGRKRMVLGSFEQPAAHLDNAFNRFLDESHFVFGYAGFEPGELVDPLHFYTCHVSVPLAAVHEVGGFDPDFSHYGCEDTDLGVRLHQAGYRMVYRPECRALHRHFLEFDVIARRQRVVAKAYTRFYMKHRDYLARNPVHTLTSAEAARKVGPVAPFLGEIEAGCRALANLDLGALERGGERFATFAVEARAQLEELFPRLNGIWWDQGYLEGFALHGLDGFPELLADWRLDLAPAEGRRVLLHADPLASPAWTAAVEAWLAVVGTPTGDSLDGSTLVVRIDPVSGLDAEDARVALAPVLRRARRNACWAPIVILVTDERVGPTRVLASVDEWIGLGTPLEEADEAIAAELAVPRVDPVSPAWEREDGPWRFSSEAPIRLLAWPDWEDPDQLCGLVELFAPLLRRRDACVVALVDPSDQDPRPALAGLDEALLAGDWRDGLELLLEALPESAQDRHRLARAVDGVLLPRGASAGRAALLETLRVPVLRSAAEVADLLARIDRSRDELRFVQPSPPRLVPAAPSEPCHA